jgi:two-component system cell cycle sensor histidine kinase/response regulator CckA
VLTAADGEQALAVCERHDGPIDLLITDVVMPGIGGPDLARLLLARRPAIKLLNMSGYDELVISDTLDHAGASFIQKPFSVTGLLDKVAELLDAS